MKSLLRACGAIVLAGLLGTGVMAQISSRNPSDQDIQTKVERQLAKKSQFRNLQASVDDGMVTLTGSVGIYQQKLDAAKRARKVAKVQGVRNLISVEGQNVSDVQLAAQLDRKLYFDRIGYDNQFNYVTASVQNGVATLSGETRTPVDRDSALSLANLMPGVKEVVNDIRVAPASNFDDDIRLRVMRAIYRDPVLSRYGMDPALPIRIVVNNGKLSLYGTVENKMDKQVAGIRASGVFGVFSVQNNLQVGKPS
jgi:hyperosmotically inducible periplasmic protein